MSLTYLSSFASISALAAQSTSGLTDNNVINVTNFKTEGDGGGGNFIWNSTATNVPDTGATILPSVSLATASGVAMITSDGVTQTWSGTFADLPIVPQSLVLHLATTTYLDTTGGSPNGQGYIAGAGTVSMTVNYQTGVWQLYLPTALPSGQTVTASYSYANSPGRWLRQVEEHINALWFGLIGDGTTNNSAAFLSANLFMGRRGGGTLYFPAGKYVSTTQNILVPQNNTRYVGDGYASWLQFQGNVFISALPFYGAALSRQSYPLMTYYPAQDIAVQGQAFLTCTNASDASHFSVGDIVSVSGSLFFTNSATDQTPIFTEVNRIVSISGAVLNLEFPIDDVYSATSQGVPVNLRMAIVTSSISQNFIIDNLRLTANATGSSPIYSGSAFSAASFGATIQNCWTEGQSGFVGNAFVRSSLMNSQMKVLFNVNGHLLTSIYFNSTCQNVLVKSCTLVYESTDGAAYNDWQIFQSSGFGRRFVIEDVRIDAPNIAALYLIQFQTPAAYVVRNIKVLLFTLGQVIRHPAIDPRVSASIAADLFLYDGIQVTTVRDLPVGLSSLTPPDMSVSFTGTISGTTLNVTTAPAHGHVLVGQTVSGTGVASPTVIRGYISGTGGTGTYLVSPSQSVGSETLTGVFPRGIVLSGTSGITTFMGTISGTTLSVTSAVSNGNLLVGQTVTGTGVTANSVVIGYGTGFGQTGTYALSQSSSVGTAVSMTGTLAAGYPASNVRFTDIECSGPFQQSVNQSSGANNLIFDRVRIPGLFYSNAGAAGSVYTNCVMEDCLFDGPGGPNSLLIGSVILRNVGRLTLPPPPSAFALPITAVASVGALTTFLSYTIPANLPVWQGDRIVVSAEFYNPGSVAGSVAVVVFGASLGTISVPASVTEGTLLLSVYLNSGSFTAPTMWWAFGVYTMNGATTPIESATTAYSASSANAVVLQASIATSSGTGLQFNQASIKYQPVEAQLS